MQPIQIQSKSIPSISSNPNKAISQINNHLTITVPCCCLYRQSHYCAIVVCRMYMLEPEMFTCFTFPNGTTSNGQPVLRVTFPNAISQHTFQPRSKLTQNFSFPSRSLAPHQNLTFLSEQLGLAVQPSGTAETKWTKHFPLAVFCVHTHTQVSFRFPGE